MGSNGALNKVGGMRTFFVLLLALCVFLNAACFGNAMADVDFYGCLIWGLLLMVSFHALWVRVEESP